MAMSLADVFGRGPGIVFESNLQKPGGACSKSSSRSSRATELFAGERAGAIPRCAVRSTEAASTRRSMVPNPSAHHVLNNKGRISEALHVCETPLKFESRKSHPASLRTGCTRSSAPTTPVVEHHRQPPRRRWACWWPPSQHRGSVVLARDGPAGEAVGSGFAAASRRRETLSPHLSRSDQHPHTLLHIKGPGQLVGRVGATGTAAGPRLDYRLKRNGVFVNPPSVIRRIAAARAIRYRRCFCTSTYFSVPGRRGTPINTVLRPRRLGKSDAVRR